MGNITVNKKMELMRQIRSRYQENRNDMADREQILYGRTSLSMRDTGYEDNDYNAENTINTFPLRLLIAAGIFLVIVICDRTDGQFGGLSAERCFQAISTDYESSIALWADTAFQPENYHDKNYPPAGIRP